MGFQERLVRHIQETRAVPNKIIVDMQRDMLEMFGFEREHGCRQLSAISTNFPDDKELHRGSQLWQHTAQQTCMTLVKQHMVCGGEFVGDVFGDNPHMQQLQAKAKEELDVMTPPERGELLNRMQKKISIFAQLPPESRERHMKKLSDDDQLEFVKAQILLVSVMKQQWQQRQSQQGAQQPPQEDEQQEAPPLA